MPPTPAVQSAIVGAVADRVNRAFDDFARAGFDQGAFFSGPPPAAAPLLPAWATGRAVCRQYARTGVGVSPLLDEVLGGACGGYLGSIGEAPTAGQTGTPFTGGQCSGVQYDVRWSGWTANVLVCDTGATSQQTQGGNNRVGGRSYLGPITSMQVEYEGQQRCGYIRAVLRIVSAEGVFTPLITSVPSGNPTLINSVAVSGLRAVRVGGGSECGDPPPESVPPRPRPGLPDFKPVVDAPGGGPGLPVNIDFNPDGTIDIGVDGWEPTVNVDFGSGGAGGAGADPLDPGQPGAGGLAEDGEPAEDEAPPGEELVGLRLDFTGPQPERSELAPGVFRGAAYVRMGTENGLALVPDAALLRSGQFVFAPREGLTKWRVEANNGFKVVVTPFYREVQS